MVMMSYFTSGTISSSFFALLRCEGWVDSHSISTPPSSVIFCPRAILDQNFGHSRTSKQAWSWKDGTKLWNLHHMELRLRESGWLSGHSCASHLYDPGSSPHVGWDLSISIWFRGFFSGYSGFPLSANSTFTPSSEPSSDFKNISLWLGRMGNNFLRNWR